MAQAMTNPTTVSGLERTEEHDAPTENSIDPAYIQYVKMAVAMAIIRSTPPGLTGQQYAESLCGAYMTSQLHWEEKARHLEEEVVLLTQRCVQRELLPYTTTLHKAKGEEDMDTDQGVNQKSEVSEKLPITQPMISSPPVTSDTSASPSMMSDKSASHKSALHLSQHTSFLRSVLTLKSLDGCPGIDRKEIENITLATAKSAIKTVERWLRDKTRHWMLSDQMVDSVLTLLCQLACQPLSEVVHGGVVESGASLIQGLLAALMEDQDLGNALEQSRLAGMVETLARCPHFRLTVVQLLVDWVTHFSDTLRSHQVKDKVVTGDDSHFQPGPYENIGHMLQILGAVINSEIQLPKAPASDASSTKLLPSSSTRCFTEELCSSIYQQLDSSLLNLSTMFPLFAHGIWRLQGLIDMLRIKRNW